MKNVLLYIMMQLFAANAIAQVTSFPENKLFSTQPEKTLTDDWQYRNDYPPIWDQPLGGGSGMGITCKAQSNPRVNNIPLEINDFIGGFYTDDFGQLRCGGASPWPGTTGVVISLKGDNPDTPEKDGFSYQEQIYFKVFSWERMKDYDVDIIDFDPNSPTTDKWISLGLSDVINIQALVDFDFYISASENTICLGSSITLSAHEFVGSNGNYTYNWTSVPSGFSSTSPNPPAATPLINTAYQLIVTDGANISEHEYLITVNVEPEVNVGDDGLICHDAIFTVSGSAINYSNIQWTTSGDGYFINDHVFVTNYYTGPNDKATGTVYLTLTAYPLEPCTEIASDYVTLTIQQPPAVNAGTDIPVCKDNLDGIPMEAIGDNFDVVLWTTSGNGTFSNQNAASTLYYPGTLDLYFGDVDLEVCVQSLSPCLMENCDDVNLSFFDNPSCFAPTVLSRCENIPIPLAGSISNSSGPLWTTQGDGTFENPNVIFTNYTGGQSDKESGSTIVTLNALPISPCTVTATKDVQLIFKPLPRLATFGDNTDYLCPGNIYLQLNAELDHYNSFSWSTLGDGTFTGSNTLSPKYYPGSGDFDNGSFELKLTATPVTPCTLTEVFTLITIIATDPDANISTANGSAYCGAVNLAATILSASDFSWSSSGDGTFSNPETLTPTYTSGPNDLASPNAVSITITAFPYCSGMSNEQSTVQLYFQDEVAVYAGSDDDFCASGSYSLDQATAANFESVFWSTSGNGYFNNPDLVNPNYFPGSNDISTGTVQLTLSGFSFNPCTLIDIDQLSLSLTASPEANAGPNTTICDTQNHHIQYASAQNFSSILWETSGDGTFSNQGIQNPVYYPGQNDISSGSAVLTLNVTGNDPCNFVLSDQHTLIIQKSPAAVAGNDASICQTENYQLQNISVNNYSSILWETSGDGQFSNASTQNPIYYPGNNDISFGEVELTITANGINPCNFSVSDSQILSIQTSPLANAGNNSTICETSTHQIQNTSAQNFSSIAWITSGDGTFSNTGIQNPVYSPGALDKFLGYANLTMNVTGINPCDFTTSDQKTLTIQKIPVANAGSNATICETGNYYIQNATAQNFSNLLWETSGDGTFNNSGISKPTYYPGGSDIIVGNVELTLTANAVSPCNISDVDNKILYIQKKPTVTLGSDQVICDQVFLFATVTNFNSLSWATSGDGTFSNPSSMLTVYYPGPNDFQNLTAAIQLFANPKAPCIGFYFDELTLTINIPTIIDDLVNDQEVNMNETLTLSFFVENPGLGEFAWFKNDLQIEGESGPQFIKTNIVPDDAGYYQCTYTNSCGEISSNMAFIQVLQPTIQVFQLQAGWQGISSFIETNETSIPNLFQNIEIQMVILSNNNGFYWPDQSLNTLGPWDNSSGYSLKMSQDATLTMGGVIRYPEEPISILPGWSYLPVNSACPVNVEELFSSYPTIEIIKDMAGTKIYWPAFGINTMGDMQPGYSYQIFNSIGFPILIEFPGCD